MRRALELALVLSIGLTPLFTVSEVLSDDNPYRLKPGARGTGCLDCHSDFEAVMALPHVHTPVAAGNCSDCHDPHASSHGKLLLADPDAMCVDCHGDVLPQDAVSVHAAVVEGRCVDCHDPHASKNPNNLIEAGNALCASCHVETSDAIRSAEFQHDPVGKGCVSCHDPHASTEAEFILKTATPELCLDCHRTDTTGFRDSHEGYPVAEADCGSCHDPHGSDRAGMMWANVHPPVDGGMCDQCHQGTSAADPLQVRAEGLDLCQGCHDRMINEAALSPHVHWPVLDAQACSSCHVPHASKVDGLLAEPMKPLCGSCHQDVIRRQERSVVQHTPVAEGECTACHTAHSSNASFLLTDTRVEEVCGNCHDWKTHSAHPMGEEVVDPRNPNLSVGCLTCHRTHGSPYDHLTHLESTGPLCVDCHEQYQR